MESGQTLVIISIPSEEAINPYEVMMAAEMVTWLLWYNTTREVLIDIQFCVEGIVGLGLDLMVNDSKDHLTLILQELSDSDDWNPYPSIWHKSAHWLCHPMFASGMHAMMLWCPILVTPFDL